MEFLDMWHVSLHYVLFNATFKCQACKFCSNPNINKAKLNIAKHVFIYLFIYFQGKTLSDLNKSCHYSLSEFLPRELPQNLKSGSVVYVTIINYCFPYIF